MTYVYIRQWPFLPSTSLHAAHAAAPRAFKPDASPRPGLSTGDAVALQCDDGDRFFRVHAASTSVGEALGQGPALLRPCGRCGPADAHTHLEVVLSGEWLGLRSAAAGDRFLQARKHGAARLAFHSANLGTWEQWQLGPGAAEALAQPWETSQPLVLQHRRLPQVQLHVTLVRVGTFLPLSVGGSTTPRSLAPVPEAGMAGLEREKLRRISDVVVQVAQGWIRSSGPGGQVESGRERMRMTSVWLCVSA